MQKTAPHRPPHSSHHQPTRTSFLTVLVTIVLALAFSRIAGGSVPLRTAEGPDDIQGLTLRYALPDGDYVERHFSSDRQAHWKLLSGSHRGDQGSESISLHEVAPGIYFVNSVDPVSGSTLSEVFDLTTRTVSSFITRPNPEDQLKRIEKFGNTKLEIISDDRAGDARARSS